MTLNFEVKRKGETITATNDQETLQVAWITVFAQLIEDSKKVLDNKALVSDNIEALMHDINRKIVVTLAVEKINPEGE